MQLMDDERKAIDYWARTVTHSFDGVSLAAFLREALAREAEYTTLVTPEWLDGAEARRLGFGRREEMVWVSETDQHAGVVVNLSAKDMGVSGPEDDILILPGVPTIAQVRAAVYLATGRR